MAILWMRFSEEATLPASFTPEEQRRFEQIYDPSDPQSVWSRSCAALGLQVRPGPLVSWYKNVPYVNWGSLVETVSCEWFTIRREGDGWDYVERKNLFNIPRLVKAQWKIERYVDERLRTGRLPAGRDEKIIESTALGLGLQAIMQRLPKNTPQEFAAWLAAPDKAPITVRKTVMQIQGIQKRRTQLSGAWLELFPFRPARDYGPETPAMFWDAPPAEIKQAAAAPVVSTTTEWQGLPVCPGQVTGRAVVLKNAAASLSALDPADLPVLVFARARPDTVELFPHASALLFAEGGALSHACTVAREQGIPCVTGLGHDFFQRMEDLSAREKVWIAIDGASGSVKIIKTQ